ncbi:MAG: hypothetical protein JST16_12530 [Bdellovibrionales bacterium]|nr:hypothetical protein [Bdellovibrionales bacterium]
MTAIIYASGRKCETAPMDYIGVESTLARAHLIMRHLEVGYLPVAISGQIVGVILEQNIRKAIETKDQIGLTPLTVGNFMLRPVKILQHSHELNLHENLSKLLDESSAEAFIIVQDQSTVSVMLREEILRFLAAQRPGDRFVLSSKEDWRIFQ